MDSIASNIKNLIRNNKALRRWYYLYLMRKEKDSPMYQWVKQKGDDVLRVKYPLTTKSVVFDFGGYEGAWAESMYKKYGCSVYVFEPVPEFADNIKKRFKDNKKVHVYELGLSDKTETLSLGLSADGSSSFKPAETYIDIKLQKADDFLNASGVDRIDLMKLNIEGGEYPLLENLIQSGWIKKVTDIQIQFHKVDGSDTRMKAIQNELEKTHRLTYQFAYLWENWKLK